MRIRTAESGEGSVLYVGERRIGYLRGDVVGFIGFGTDDEAARAACIAYRALVRRRAGTAAASAPEEYLFGHTEEGQFVIAQSGVLARLIPPDVVTGEESWGFEIALRPDESIEIFAMARARLMWNALRSSGLGRRMAQFAGTARLVGAPRGPSMSS